LFERALISRCSSKTNGRERKFGKGSRDARERKIEKGVKGITSDNGKKDGFADVIQVST
jgi:hypothetical protein